MSYGASRQSNWVDRLSADIGLRRAGVEPAAPEAADMPRRFH